MTFEKVLDVFQDDLRHDPLYEVVLTRHGYALMGWEPKRDDWYSVEAMHTPEDLLAALLKVCADLWEDQLTGNERELTPAEQDEITRRCLLRREQCETEP